MALQIPGYVIHREIGAGGMAKVFLATQTSLDRQVALKVMSPALATDPTFAKRFQREARTIAGLTHPNIVAVYEVGSVQHMHFFAMQHLAGGDLAGKLRKGIPEPEVVRIVCGVARALGFAHSRGVVHRDVTPGNILFDATENPVLTDFGIARSQQGSTRITHTGVSIGTSSYMSPEQARGGEVDARSDLYSLGALLFETLSGKPPYSGVDGFAVAYAHVFEPVPRLPPGLEHWQPLIEKAMAKAPEDRFANSDEMIAAIQQVTVNPHRILPVVLKGSESSKSGVAPVAVKPAVPSAAQNAAALVATLPAGALPTIPMPPAPVAVPTQRVLVALPQPPAVVVSDTAEIPVLVPRRGLPALAWVALVAGLGLGYSALAWFNSWAPFGQPSPPPVIVVGNPPVEPPPVTPPPVETGPVVTPAVSDPVPPVSNGSDIAASDPGTPLTDDQAVVGVDLNNPDGSQLVDPNAPAEPGAEGEAPVEPFVGPPTRADFVRPILASAAALLKKGNLTTPPRGNSFEVYRYVLLLDPSNAEARQGLVDTVKAIEKLALEAYAKGDLPVAMEMLGKADVVARSLGPKEPMIAALAAHSLQWLEQRSSSALAAEKRWAAAEAETLYREMLQIDKNSKAAAEGLKRTAVLGKPGYRFADAMKAGGQGPQMVVVAPGAVTLADERNGKLAVKVATAYAMQQREVSLGEFKRFVTATGKTPGAGRGCADKEGFQMFASKDRTWLKPGFEQTDRHPVTCIGVADAEAYARWISEQTGHRYALPSEPQWWLAAGALSLNDCKRGNLGDASFGKLLKGRRPLGCDDGHPGTAPVGSFGAAANALYDMAGNVREWTADCYLKTVTGRAANETPWTSGNCNQRLILGTAWVSGTDERVSIPRVESKPQELNNTVGFRLVMELP